MLLVYNVFSSKFRRSFTFRAQGISLFSQRQLRSVLFACLVTRLLSSVVLSVARLLLHVALFTFSQFCIFHVSLMLIPPFCFHTSAPFSGISALSTFLTVCSYLLVTRPNYFNRLYVIFLEDCRSYCPSNVFVPDLCMSLVSSSDLPQSVFLVALL